MEEYIVCPFCGEEDFDLVGLKIHLLNWCDTFKALEDVCTNKD